MSISIQQNGHPVSTSARNSAQHRSTISDGAILSPADLAEQWHLKLQSNGKWVGPHPTDKTLASKDGFILCPEGNAFTNSGVDYHSKDVAALAGLSPEQYAPCSEWMAQNGNSSNPVSRVKIKGRAAQSSPVEPTAAPEPIPSLGAKSTRFDWSSARTFDYLDEEGNLLIQVGRIGDGATKDIRQRRPNGKGGWEYSLGDARRVLYRLQEVLAARVVFICEGEKAADRLNAALEEVGLLGPIVATCNIGGAGKWKDEYNSALEGKSIGVLPDNDIPGKEHGAAVCSSIHLAGVAVSLKRLDLPGLPSKGDICEWLEEGNTVTQLLELFEAQSEWKPEKESGPFEIFTLDDLELLPRPQWLIQNVLIEGVTSIISADSGSFKSFIALDMALCVATGTPFHGLEVKQGTVVYVAPEGFFTMRDRATAWLMEHKTGRPKNFHILRAPVAVADPGIAAAFLAQVKELNPALIILDTLSQCALGLNENANDEMALFVAGMMNLGTQCGAHVCAIHHNSKAGGFRGASAIHANVDARISLERPEGDDTNTVFIRCEKQRGKPFAPFALRGEEIVLPYTDEYDEEITSLVFQLAGAADIPSAKHPSTKKADAVKTRLMQVFDEIAAEQGGVKIGTFKSKVEKRGEEDGDPICSERSFWLHLKSLKGEDKRHSKPEIELFDHPVLGELWRRVTATTATTAKMNTCSYCSESAKRGASYCNYCNNPLGVAVVAVSGDAPGLKKSQSPKSQAARDSETYSAPALAVTSGGIFGTDDSDDEGDEY